MNGTFQIDGIRVETQLNRIHTAGGMVQVEPKIMQVLACLAERAGEVVSKDDLVDAVWPDTSATDDVLARAISELRKVFNDDPRAPRVIETIRKGGYRLLSPVRPAGMRRPRFLNHVIAGALAGALMAIALWLGLPDGEAPVQSESVPLTSYRGVEREPAVAPFGRRVAFSWNGPQLDNWDIYVKLPGEETPQRLTQSPLHDGSPAWSPDGDRVAYRRLGEGVCEIRVVPATGGQSGLLAPCKANNFGDLVWSADGRWLAHNDVVSEGLHAVFRIDADTGAIDQVTHPPPAIWGDYDPAFSPKGNLLAFARALSEGIQDVFVVDLNSGAETRLTEDNRNIYGLTWTPDGSQVVFASNRGGSYDLWAVPGGGGEILAVIAGADSVVNPSFDGKGEILVYEHRRYDTDIWRYQLAPGPGDENPSIAAASTRWELYPAVSRSGLRMAHASDRSGSYEIWVSELDGSLARRLTQFGGPLTSFPSWSPDDTAIAFDARPDGHADIFVINPDTGQQDRLTDHPADDVAPGWSLSGDWIYFGSNRDGAWQIWRMPAAGGKAERVTRGGGMRAMDTPRGLCFTRPGDAGLWLVEGDSERQILDHPVPVDWGNWHAGEQGIYIVDRSAAAPTVMLHPWDGEPVQIMESHRMIPPSDSALSVSRDGQVVLFGGIVDRWVDLVMVSRPQP